jgi:hypothetical protein
MKEHFSVPRFFTIALLMIAGVFIFNACDDEKSTPMPSITSFDPRGAEGSLIEIHGANFSMTLSQNTVMFNLKVAEVTSASKTKLTVLVPAGATSGKITLTVNGITIITESDFIVTTATLQISETGGQLVGSDGVVLLNIPPGAVPSGAIVSILETEEVVPNAIGKVYTLTPEGTEFAQSIKVSFQYDESDVANIPASTMAIAFKKDDNSWQIMPTLELNESTKTITTQTTHFSQWALFEVPTLTNFAPETGSVGTIITITGTNFSETATDNKVYLNGSPVEVTSSSATEIIALVPEDATSGKILVTTLYNGLNWTVSSSSDFTVEENEPTITSFAPTTGAPGTMLTITGENFNPSIADNKVFINGIEAVVTASSSTAIVAIVPVGATTGQIIVTTLYKTLNWTMTSTMDFTVVNPEPVITSFTPASGTEGTIVTITGQHFTGDISQNKISFNGAEAVITAFSPTAITAIVPVGATSGRIILTTSYNNLIWNVLSSSDFTVESKEPFITSFTPTTGTPGTMVSIKGGNFDALTSNNKIFFNGVASTIISASPTEIVALVPTAATSGKILLSTLFNNLDWIVTSPTDFIVLKDEPQITSFTPTSGTVGTVVTITGTNFSTVPSENKIFFNGLLATTVTSSKTQLTAIVPSGAVSGKIMVTTVFNGLDWTTVSIEDFVVN